MALLPLLLAGLMTGQAPAPADSRHVDALLGMVRERLEIAHDVARAKFASGAPIEDLPREAAVIEDVRGQAPSYGVDPEFAAAFFRAQIEASKAAQRNWQAQWRAGLVPSSTIPNLAQQIRPRIDSLTGRLLATLATARRVPPTLRREQSKALAPADPRLVGPWRIAVGPLL